MSDAQQFQHARRHVGQLQDASPLLYGGRLEANQRSQARAIQMLYIAKVDHDPPAKRDEGPYQILDRIRCVGDQFAMTLDRCHLIPALIFIYRLLNIAAERTISCHSEYNLLIRGSKIVGSHHPTQRVMSISDYQWCRSYGAASANNRRVRSQRPLLAVTRIARFRLEAHVFFYF